MSRPSVFRLAVAAVLVTSISSCSDATAGPPSGTGVVRDELTGLEHRVTLMPSMPTAGGAVEIRSVLTNQGTEPVTVSSRTCGLDYGGTLGFAPNGSPRCGGYSTTGSLAVGESRTGTDLNRVASSPGVYILRVRHAVQPELWVDVPVVVH